MRPALILVCCLMFCCSGNDHPTPGGGASGAIATPSSGGVATTGGTAAMANTSAAGGSPSSGGSSIGAGGAPNGATAGTATIGAAGSGGTIPGGGGSPTTGSGGIAGTATSGGAAGNGAGGSTSERPQLIVTADFLNQSLSVVDAAKLSDGSKREDALVGTVDLSKYAPGPLDLAITPDGKTALVAVSGGWLGAFTTVPPGNGTLLFVDIATRKVTAELYTGASPMGIAITRDGKRAFVGQYGETYFASVDIAAHTFDKIQTGQQFNEELAIDDTGTVGILSYGPAGNCVTFAVSDPAGMQGATLGLTGDAGGTAFFPGTKLAFVVQAPTALTGNVGGHNVVDVTNPRAPVASDNIRTANSPTWYRVTAVAPRKSVTYPSTQNNKLSLVEMKLNGSTAEQVQIVPVGDAKSLAYGVTSDASGRVFVAVAEEHYVAIVDLNTARSTIVPWDLTKTGPTDVAVVP